MLQKIKLWNFKKFTESIINFNNGTNILLGANDSGKSSVLKAIDIVLNQSGTDDWKNRSAYGTLLNNDSVQTFLKTKPVTSQLPIIKIEAWIELEEDIKNANFDGINNSENLQAKGIVFEYAFDDEFSSEFQNMVHESGGELPFIPFEFYKATWRTFSGKSYSFRSNPLKSILIDNDRTAGDSFSSYAARLLDSLSNTRKNTINIQFKNVLSRVSDHESLSETGLGVDVNRIRPIDLLEAYSEEQDSKTKLPLRDMGSGTENYIKTELALKTQAKLVLVEEPENHLDLLATRKQIETLKKVNKTDNRQLIITTHSPVIASRLNLNNVLWIKENTQAMSFKNLDMDTVNYFNRLDNVDVLQLLLSRKIILVEGPTEYVLMNNMITQVLGNTGDSLGIHVFSMGGDHFKRYVELASCLHNKVVIFTDNDQKLARINEANTISKETAKVFMPQNEHEFTFEVALFESNAQMIQADDDFLSSKSNTWKKHNDLNEKLVYMLEHKVDSALKYEEKFTDKSGLVVPEYIAKGLKWLIK